MKKSDDKPSFSRFQAITLAVILVALAGFTFYVYTSLRERSLEISNRIYDLDAKVDAELSNLSKSVISARQDMEKFKTDTTENAGVIQQYNIEKWINESSIDVNKVEAEFRAIMDACKIQQVSSTPLKIWTRKKIELEYNSTIGTMYVNVNADGTVNCQQWIIGETKDCKALCTK